MARSVITTQDIKEHNVEPYRFRVIGSTPDVPKKAEENIEDEKEEIKEENKEEENHQQKVDKKSLEPNFVEELLKKTDELSSNIVKLQIKIESQEEEFEKRLVQETKKAKEEGEIEGEKRVQAATKESQEKLETQFGKALHLLEEAGETLKAFLKKCESELSDAAIDVAKEVVKKEVSKDSVAVSVALAKALVKELIDATKVEVKVNPKTYEAVKEAFEPFEHIDVGADDAISEGGAIVLSDVGNIDATLATRLEKVKQMMKE